VGVRWRSLFLSTSLGKRCTSYNAPPTSLKRSYGCFKRCFIIWYVNFISFKSRDSSVGIALGYGLGDGVTRVRFLAGAGNFSLHHRVQNDSGAHPASYPMVLGALSLEIKRPGREANHSPQCSAEVKYVFMAWCLVKQRDNFAFTLLTWSLSAVRIVFLLLAWSKVTLFWLSRW
jgi:hypothetical protein